MRYFFSWIWKMMGWKIIGQPPADQPKYVIIVAPHTTNWDFVIGVMARSILGFDSRFLGKKSLFRPPFGWFFRWMGGYPVDRNKSTNLVDQVVEIFQEHENFVVALAPEGTRAAGHEWKTGFYYIAIKAKVPIVRAKIDWPSKSVVFFETFWPTGNIQADMPAIKSVYEEN